MGLFFNDLRVIAHLTSSSSAEAEKTIASLRAVNKMLEDRLKASKVCLLLPSARFFVHSPFARPPESPTLASQNSLSKVSPLSSLLVDPCSRRRRG